MLLNYRRGILAKKLEEYLNEDSHLRKVFSAVKKEFKNSKLTAHNWEHIYRDTLHAIVIGEAEGADMRIVLPAILMHDIGFLYGGTGETHAEIGTKKLPHFLKKHRLLFTIADKKHIADCILTHKGSMHNKKPETLEAKVVADADLLEKFGLFGIYQGIRTFTEFHYDIEKIIKRLSFTRKLSLETKTGRKFAKGGLSFVLNFGEALDRAYDPYRP